MNPNLSTRVEEHVQKTFGNLGVTNFPINTATWCIFARDCMWASLQMRRTVETHTRGLSELFLRRHAGFSEHTDWESS